MASLQASFRTWTGRIGFVEQPHGSLYSIQLHRHRHRHKIYLTEVCVPWAPSKLDQDAQKKLVYWARGGGDEQGELRLFGLVARGAGERVAVLKIGSGVSLNRVFRVSRATSHDGIMSQTFWLGAPALGGTNSVGGGKRPMRGPPLS